MGATTHDNFEFLAAEGIEAGIKVREDANPHCGGVAVGLWAEVDGRDLLFRIQEAVQRGSPCKGV